MNIRTIIIFSLLALTSACDPKISEQLTSHVGVFSKTIDTQTEQHNRFPSNNNVTSSEFNSFFGEWVVQKVFPNNEIGTYDEEDYRAIIGKHIVYSDAFIKFDNKIVIEKPTYEVKPVSNFDHLEKNLEEFEISSESIKEVIVYDQTNQNWVPKNRLIIGTFFYIKDEKTLIASRNADNFELKRIQ